MKSIIILEVEHGDTIDPLDKILDHVVERYGEQVITDYAVRVDLPASFLLDSDMPSRDAIFKACAASPREILSLIEPDPWRTK